MRKKFLIFIGAFFYLMPAFSAKISFTVNGNPVTDEDIAARIKIMPATLNNHEDAKNAIIDDFVRIEYAKQLRIEPSLREVNDAIKEHKDNPQMHLSARANVAWQMTIMRAIVPTISVDDKDIAAEFADIELERGLPFDLIFLRVVKVPSDIYEKFGKAKDCADAEKMVRVLGGDPQKISAKEYDLSQDVRKQFIGLANLTWSPLVDGVTYFICSKKKTEEWGKLDDIIRQNAVYKRAMFQADQLLKQLRRKAVITN